MAVEIEIYVNGKDHLGRGEQLETITNPIQTSSLLVMTAMAAPNGPAVDMDVPVMVQSGRRELDRRQVLDLEALRGHEGPWHGALNLWTCSYKRSLVFQSKTANTLAYGSNDGTKGMVG